MDSGRGVPSTHLALAPVSADDRSSPSRSSAGTPILVLQLTNAGCVHSQGGLTPDESPRSITRRRSLQLLGGGLFVAGAGSIGGVALRGIADGDDYVADAAAACSLTPEQEEGPYYVAVDTVTDKHGLATFHTVYPGHYRGRTTHIHVKVHTGSADKGGKLTGGHVAHTRNLFSSDAVNAEVYGLSPYSSDHAAIVPGRETWSTGASTAPPLG